MLNSQLNCILIQSQGTSKVHTNVHVSLIQHSKKVPGSVFIVLRHENDEQLTPRIFPQRQQEEPQQKIRRKECGAVSGESSSIILVRV